MSKIWEIRWAEKQVKLRKQEKKQKSKVRTKRSKPRNPTQNKSQIFWRKTFLGEKETTEEESVAESIVMPPQANPKRKRQDEVTFQPADSLNLMFGYFDKKFEAMQNQIDQK